MGKGFYKENNGSLIYAKNSVEHKDYKIEIDNKDQYQYPVYGWHYFESLEEAQVWFDIVPEPELEL